MSPSTERRESPRVRRAWGSFTNAQIVETALQIARTEGTQALTIRRLAADLGAPRMSLYRHVADNDALIDLVMEAIAAHHVVPPDLDGKPWPDILIRAIDTAATTNAREAG